MNFPSLTSSKAALRTSGVSHVSSVHLQRKRMVCARFTSSTGDAQPADQLQDPLWFGPRPNTKASRAVETPVKASRQDVRLIAAFNNQVEKNSLQLVGGDR